MLRVYTLIVLLVAGMMAITARSAYTQVSSNVSGMQVLGGAVAAEFGKWSVGASTGNLSAGVATITLDTSTLGVFEGLPIQPITTTIPLRIDDWALSETVTPSAVNCSSGSGICTFTATFTYAHPYRIRVLSGTSGLQEAIDFMRLSNSGGKVFVTPGWRGTTQQIIDATGVTSVLIEDSRSGVNIWYTWDGSDYVPTLNLSSTSGIAPNTPTYITQTANSGLSAEQALSSLTANKLLRNTSGGVLAASLVADNGSTVTITNPTVLDSAITVSKNGSKTNNILITIPNVGYGVDGNSVYIGSYSGTGGGDTVAVGYQTLQSYTGVDATAVGFGACEFNTSGSYNTCIGNISNGFNTTGSFNTVVGFNALGGLSGQPTGENTVVGASAANHTYGATGRNVVMGFQTLYTNTTGANNVVLGYAAGYYSTGDNNTYVGTNAQPGIGVNGSNNTVIGNGAASSGVTVSNEITLGNGSVTRFRVPGVGLDFSVGSGLALTGQLVVNNTTASDSAIISNTNVTSSNGLRIDTQTTSITDYGLIIRSNAGSNTVLKVVANGFVGIGGQPIAKLHIRGDVSSAAWLTGGIQLYAQDASYTDTTSSGTVAAVAVNTFGQPTLLASSSTTYTNASTVYIQGSPVASTNVTETNPWSLYVAAGNSAFLGRLEHNQGTAVTAANDLTLGQDGNVFSITGATQINAITTARWRAGSEITLIFASTPTVKNNTAGGGGTAVLLLAGGADFVASSNDTLTLIYNGTSWFEKARSVN